MCYDDICYGYVPRSLKRSKSVCKYYRTYLCFRKLGPWCKREIKSKLQLYLEWSGDRYLEELPGSCSRPRCSGDGYMEDFRCLSWKGRAKGPRNCISYSLSSDYGPYGCPVACLLYYLRLLNNGKRVPGSTAEQGRVI